jgi:hypothetical protein
VGNAAEKLEEDGRSKAQRVDKRVTNPGAWELLCDGFAVGVRRKMMGYEKRSTSGHHEAKGLRHRFPHQSKGLGSKQTEFWEMWMVSISNKTDVEDARPLVKAEEGPGQLIVPGIGPRVTVGLASVAFGFGNVIKVVTVGGQQRFEASKDGMTRGPWQSAGRRRKSGGLGRVRSGS